jgi:hypothetical protein
MTMQGGLGATVPAPRGCDWCGDPISPAMLAGPDPAHAVCSQACHEWRKQARGKAVSYGLGGAHPYVPPAEPNRWPGWEERRASAREQRRAASQAATRARAARQAAPDGSPALTGTGGVVPAAAIALRAVPADEAAPAMAPGSRERQP